MRAEANRLANADENLSLTLKSYEEGECDFLRVLTALICVPARHNRRVGPQSGPDERFFAVLLLIRR